MYKRQAVLRRPRNGYVRARTALTRLAFERGLTDTSPQFSLERFGLDHPEREIYGASGWFSLHRALPPAEVGPHDVFLDFGSGMGRAVYMAARRYPFARVMGVEISPELTEIARRNIEHNRARLRCTDVELVVGDAATYEMPDDVTIVYMFNPFKGSVFQAALESIVRSLDRAPRPLRIVYQNPVEEQRILDSGRFRVARRRRTRSRWPRNTNPWIVTYASLGPGRPRGARRAWDGCPGDRARGRPGQRLA